MVFLLTVWICIIIYKSKKREEKSNQLLKSQQLAIQNQNEQLNKLNEEIMVQNDSIQEQYKMLDQLNNVKNQLFSVISHDVRSPLNSIKGALELFEKGYLEAEEVKEMAGRLKVKVQNTSALLDNLLQWSRSQMEGIKVNSVKVDLQKIAEQNFQLYAPIAEEKGVVLENHINEPVHAFADPEMIMTVVRNLLGNAVKFTESNGRVSLHAENQQDHIIFSVKDSGVGMTTEQSKMIFNENHLSTPGTNLEIGTGLGLLLCKEFVDKNGGRIWVESKIKKGSSFYFSLPKAVEEVI
jgi:signal transduction histidine kinase